MFNNQFVNGKEKDKLSPFTAYPPPSPCSMMRHLPLGLLLIVLSLFCVTPCFASDVVQVSIADFGLAPDAKTNAVPFLRKALAACKKHKSCRLVFPKGRYDFYVTLGGNTVVFDLTGMKNLCIDGAGSEFVFHGPACVATIHETENVTMENFSVDWDKPYIVQGTILDTQEQWVDIAFDEKEYPFEITAGKILFLGEGWKKSPNGYTLLFDKTTKEIVYNTRDDVIGNSDWFSRKSEDRGGGIVRFHGKTRYRAEPGTIIALWLGRYMVAGFSIRHSKDTTLRNIDIFHVLSNGVFGWRSENITISKVNYLANEKKGRVFSSIADGFHFNLCKGLVKVEYCTAIGLGDDIINLRGINTVIRKILDDRAVQVGVDGQGNRSQGLAVDDEVWFIDATTLQRQEVRTIVKIEEVMEQSRAVARRIVFDAPLPKTLKVNDVLENKTWCASLEVRGCNILKKHRARGILVTTPQPVLIENNFFRTAGAAILIAGDVNYWFESGACNEVVIRNNVFEDCYTSGGGWGKAVITIEPSFKPQSNVDEAFHRNIRIENNVFKTFDYPVLFARSVRDLAFVGNKILKTSSFLPYAKNQYTFYLDGCRNMVVKGNSYADDLLGKNMLLQHMASKDVVLEDQAIQIVDQDN